MKSVLQITLGILLAGLVTLLVRIGYLSYIEYRLTQGLNEFAMQQKQTELARQQAEYQIQQKLQQKALDKSRTAKQNEATRLRKAEAWRKYYLVPEDCKNFKSDEHMVNCLNHKADAKFEFERVYNNKLL